jgi:hypothetical protein
VDLSTVLEHHKLVLICTFVWRFVDVHTNRSVRTLISWRPSGAVLPTMFRIITHPAKVTISLYSYSGLQLLGKGFTESRRRVGTSCTCLERMS